MTKYFSLGRTLVMVALLLFIGACQHFSGQPGQLIKPIEWSDLPGWADDRHSEAWPAMLKGCVKLSQKAPWDAICQAAQTLGPIDDGQAKQFFEQWFIPQQLLSTGGERSGLITGYYEPLLQGSYAPDERYRFPLYGSPEDMLSVELADLYPELKGKRIRARLSGNKIIPYYSRSDIEGALNPLQGQELLWTDDRDALFFLQIQGSGRIELPDGQIIGAGYANQNGHPYVSIGKVLIERGELEREAVTLFSIKKWLRDHPALAQDLLNANPSYVFFALRDEVENGPIGSLNVPLSPQRSIAIDPKVVPLGSAMWLSTSYPEAGEPPLKKLVFAQDTGGAIKGRLRADVFWGTGDLAQQRAGNMKQKGELYLLAPK